MMLKWQLVVVAEVMPLIFMLSGCLITGARKISQTQPSTTIRKTQLIRAQPQGSQKPAHLGKLLLKKHKMGSNSLNKRETTLKEDQWNGKSEMMLSSFFFRQEHTMYSVKGNFYGLVLVFDQRNVIIKRIAESQRQLCLRCSRLRKNKCSQSHNCDLLFLVYS